MKPDHYLEQESIRPMDWQDRLVIRASCVAIVVLLAVLIWGPR